MQPQPRLLPGPLRKSRASGSVACLAAFDEGGEARYLVIKDKAYAIDNERLVVRPDDAELDAEAAATDGAFYYVTGSHSAKRKDCANNREPAPCRDPKPR